MYPSLKHNRLRSAGGFSVCDGGPGFYLVKRNTIGPWRKAVKQLLLNKQVRKNDPRIERMLTDAATEWSTYERPAYNQWTQLTPEGKQQALFAWILYQRTKTWKRQHKPIDILAAGIAGDLYSTYCPQQRNDSYARAANIGRSVWILLRREWRTYEHNSNYGSTRLQHVWINENVRLRSRYAAQRIEAAIRKHAGWFMEEYHGRLAMELQKAQLI